MPNIAVVGAREKLERKINAWLREHLIPRLAGVFGEKCSVEEAEYTVTRPRGSFFLSDLFFTSIRFPGSSTREWFIVVKLPSQDPQVRTHQNFTDLFTNEILFYQRVADVKCKNYPKCYFAGDDPVFEKVIVLENVNARGFSISPKKINIAIDYVLAGLQSIAKFHSSTYAMKEKEPKKFYQIVNDINLVRYNKETIFVPYMESVNNRLPRVSKGLRERKYDPLFTKQIEDLFKDCYNKVLMKCVEPVEPLATIIHGDTTINNIMYKKTDSEKFGGLEAILIDFGLMMYSTPAVDISILIYMCLSREDIQEYSESLFNAYYDTLHKNLEEQNIWSSSKYSRDAFWRDYKQHAIFGYVTAAYFLPIMTEFEGNNDLLQLDKEIIDEVNISGGGETLTNTLVDMLIDARKAGFLDYYLNDVNAEDCVCKAKPLNAIPRQPSFLTHFLRRSTSS